MGQKIFPKILFAASIAAAVVGGGYLVYMSGHPRSQNDSMAETVTLYFGSTVLNPDGNPCDEVFPVTRLIARTDGRIQTTLAQLFFGPTESEKVQGYHSWFSPQTRSLVHGISVKDRVAYVNFGDIDKLIPNASTSCGSTQFFSEVEATIKQFPEVNEVIFAINGKPSAFYDWMQIGCTASEPRCDEAPFQE